MRFEDLTNEQIEKAKACTTKEEKIAFLEEYNIEIPDDMLDEISGGKKRRKTGGSDSNDCPYANGMNNGHHRWSKTGRQRPGSCLGSIWKDDELRCEYCGELRWTWW